MHHGGLLRNMWDGKVKLDNGGGAVTGATSMCSESPFNDATTALTRNMTHYTIYISPHHEHTDMKWTGHQNKCTVNIKHTVVHILLATVLKLNKSLFLTEVTLPSARLWCATLLYTGATPTIMWYTSTSLPASASVIWKVVSEWASLLERIFIKANTGSIQ